MKTHILLQIDALIAELESLKTNAALLKEKEASIKAHIAQIRAALNFKSTVPERKKAGFAKGFVSYMAEDFDAPIDDMVDYS